MKVTSRKIPALRFPEFEGEWEERKIESSIDLLTGYPFKGEEISDEKGGIPLLRGINITEGRIRHSEEIDRYYHGELKGLEKFLSNSGDLVLGMDGSKVGKNSAILDEKNSGTLLVQRVARIRGKSNSSLNFIFHHINSIKFHDYVAKVNTSSGIPHISPKQIKDFKIYFPTHLEQQKIATFLTTIDTRIQQLSRKKALMEQYKKGVMQQLFSQEIRFKNEEGKEFPAWEEKKLADISKIYDGTHQTPNYVNKGVPFYSVEHITRDDFKNTKLISEEVFEKENQRVKLEKGDILMTRIGDIGTPKYISWEVRASFYVSLALIKQSTLFNARFLNQFIQSIFFQKELHKRTIHVAFPKKINLGEIGNCRVQLPSLPEQQKIAAFLTAIDRQINSVSQQLERMQTFKKGLLQQLFV